jgi:hypothetical protein
MRTFGWIILFLAVFPVLSYGYELNSTYATVIYGQRKDLVDFSGEMAPEPGGLVSLIVELLRGRSTPDDKEIGRNIDAIVEEVEQVLQIYPRHLHVRMVLLSSPSVVGLVYCRMYGAKDSPVAFYSPHMKTLFLPSQGVDRTVLVHEITHALVDRYFVVPPSIAIQEALAHFVQRQLAN